MSTKKLQLAEQICLGVLLGLAAIGTIIRIVLGADIFDEALYAAETHLTLMGSVPVVSNWTQFAPFTLILAPILKLFYWFSGGTSGAILYMRVAYLIFKAVLLLLICLLLKKYFPLRVILPAGVCILVPAYANIPALSYTDISMYFFLLSGILFASEILSGRNFRRPAAFTVVAGCLSALGAAVYPTHVFTCFILALALLLWEIFSHRFPRMFLGYAFGGLLTAVLFVVYMAVRGGGVSSILYGIEQILSLGYFNARIRSPLIEFIWSTLIVGASLIFWLVLFVVLLAVCLLRLRKTSGLRSRMLLRQANWLQILFSCGWISYLLNLLIGVILYCFLPGVLFTSYYRTFMIQIVVPPFLLAPVALGLVRKKHPYCDTLFVALWFPMVIWLAVIGFSAFDGYASRCLALISGMFCFLVFSALYAEDVLSPKKALFRKLSGLAVCLFASVVSLYGYFYADDMLSALDFQITEGAYAGLYTTEARGNGLIELERELRTHLTAEDTVLFKDTAPMAYFMSDAIPCTPSAWDWSLPPYSWHDPSSYLNYFSLVGKLPDKIVYITTSNSAALSIDIPDLEINDFVNYYYEETYSSDDGAFFPIRIYTKTSVAEEWQP